VTTEFPTANQAGGSEPFPEDIELDEAGRNWVSRQSASDPHRTLRHVAADAAVTAAIGNAYGSD